MKNIKASKIFCRVALFLSICLITASLFSVFASADTVDFFKKWTLSEEKNVIYGDGVPYYKVEDRGFSVIRHKGYVFYNELSNDNGDYVDLITSTDADGSYLWTSSGEFYATEEGRKVFDDLKSLSAVSRYQLCDGRDYRFADITDDAVNRIFFDVSKASPKTVDYAALGYRVGYELLATHTDGFVEYAFASVYLMDGVWYYLDYSSLSDEHYGIDGELNYRDGKVKVYPLSETSETAILQAENNLNYPIYEDEKVYEDDLYTDKFIEENRVPLAVVVLLIAIVVTALVAFVLPLPVFALGLILPQIKKLGRPKYWYSLSVFAVVWTALALLLFLIVALAVLI